MEHAGFVSNNTSPAVDDSMLLREQTLSSLAKNISIVYRRHFWRLFLCVLLPMGPFALLQAKLEQLVSPSWALLVSVPHGFALFVASGAMTVMLSDICVGNRPSVRRSYSRILRRGRWWYLFSTGMLFGLAIWAGLMLLLLPGLWIAMRGCFSSVIVALEGRKNRDAIRRSFALTKGQVWRIGVPLLLSYMLAWLASVMVVVLAEVIMMFLGLEMKTIDAVAHIFADLVWSAVFGPMTGMALVLLYYDQRVARESYDSQALSEDLMR